MNATRQSQASGGEARWRRSPLQEVATIERITVGPGEIQGPEPYVGLENITGSGEFWGVAAAGESRVRSNKFAFTSQHILYGKLRPYLAKIAAPDFDGICSTDILPIRPGDKLDRRFFLHYMRTPAMVMYAAINAVGISLPRLSPRRLETFEIPIPTIEEQRRIAAVLDSAEVLRAKRRRTLTKLDSLTQAIFVDVVGDGTRWPSGKLGEHVPTTSGGTPSRARPEYFGGGIPWVKSGELGSDLVATTEESITEAALANSSAKLMPAGTVLLAMYGATVGELAMLGIEAATNQAVCCLSPTESITGAFLLGFLRSRRRDLIRRAAGGAQPNISQTIIRGLEIPLVPIATQMEYARRVAAADMLRAAFRDSAAELDNLFASLQQRAFRGEL